MNDWFKMLRNIHLSQSNWFHADTGENVVANKPHCYESYPRLIHVTTTVAPSLTHTICYMYYLI